MKSNLQILKSINENIVDLEQNEINEVLKLLQFKNCNPMVTSERIAAYLSETLPVNVEADLIMSFL